MKVLRQVIRIRKQDQQERDEQETLLDMYLQAIGGGAVKAAASERKAGTRRTKAAEQHGAALA